MMNRSPDDLALISSFNAAHDASVPGSTAAVAAAAAGTANIYAKSRFGKSHFIIKHFAGEVVYDIAGFIAKNNDSLQVTYPRTLS